MDKISGYIVANGQGGYDVIEKTSQTSTKPFTIPFLDEDISKTDNTPKTDANRDFKYVDYNPFKDMAMTGNVNLPGYMHTQTTPTRSDEEILKELEELAREHARTGQFQNQSNDQRFLKLMDEFISSVSPDRESILKNTVAEINGRLYQGYNSMDTAFQQIDSQRKHKKEEDEKEPIDYFIEALKNKGKGSGGATSTITRNGIYHTETIDHGGGMITYLNYVNGEFASMNLQGNNYFVGGVDNSSGAVVNAQILDDNGEWIMYYRDNELMQSYTKAETLRSKEFLATYNAAFDVAVGRHQEDIKPIDNNIGDNAFAKEYLDVLNKTYNKVYERLTSGSVA